MTLKEEKCNSCGWNNLAVVFSLPHSNRVNVYHNKSRRKSIKYNTFKMMVDIFPKGQRLPLEALWVQTYRNRWVQVQRDKMYTKKKWGGPLEKAIKHSICVVFQRKTGITKQDLRGSSLSHNHCGLKVYAQQTHICPQEVNLYTLRYTGSGAQLSDFSIFYLHNFWSVLPHLFVKNILT